MLCLLLRGLNNSWIIDSVYTIKRHAYPVIMSVQTAGPEHGPCAIEKNSICKFSGELYSGWLSWDSYNSLMGLEQQPEGGLCFGKPCFVYCYED